MLLLNSVVLISKLKLHTHQELDINDLDKLLRIIIISPHMHAIQK